MLRLNIQNAASDATERLHAASGGGAEALGVPLVLNDARGSGGASRGASPAAATALAPGLGSNSRGRTRLRSSGLLGGGLLGGGLLDGRLGGSRGGRGGGALLGRGLLGGSLFGLGGRGGGRGGADVGRSSAALDESGDTGGSDGLDEVVLELGEGRQGGGLLESLPGTAGGVDAVDLASTADGRGARASGQGVGDVEAVGVGLAIVGGVDGLEGVTLDQGDGAGVELKGVALHVGEQVVGRLEGPFLAELGGAAGDVVPVVAIEGHLVAVTVEHHGPVVVAVAGGRGGGDTVKLVVGDGSAGAVVVADDELTADQGDLVVVDPDTIVASLQEG